MEEYWSSSDVKLSCPILILIFFYRALTNKYSNGELNGLFLL